MKRFHVHLHVQNLQASIAFYSRLFDAQPARVEADYAKWMLEDPRINFAISTRGTQAGLDHLGLQVDSADELDALKQTAAAADMSMIDEGQTTCCYARSEKHWIVDPDGNAWEHFHTLDAIPLFSEKPAGAQACETPVASAQFVQQSVQHSMSESAGACCAPAATGPASVQAVAVSSISFGSRKGVGPSAKPATSACCGPASDKSNC